MRRNAVMKTVNLWASKKVLRLHLTIKTSPCAIPRLPSCPLWNCVGGFFYPSEAGRELFLPLGYFRCFKNHSSPRSCLHSQYAPLQNMSPSLPNTALFLFFWLISPFSVFSTKMLLIPSQIEFKNNIKSPERK